MADAIEAIQDSGFVIRDEREGKAMATVPETHEDL